MNGLTARWSFRAPLPPEAERLPLPARILAARGVHDPHAAAAFLDPRLTHLHDPSLIPDLDRAAARILHALRAGEPIVIYGDYDVDGITASAILFHAFNAIAPGAPVRTYVPHRLEEGYGLNTAAIAELARGDADHPPAKLIVSVDCGVTAVEPARVARQHAVDLVITDHHCPPARLEDLPDAFAVVHPRRPDSAYPFPDLCGAGVAYKLAWRLATLHAGSGPGGRVPEDLRRLLIDLLAFAALGTIADIVPLHGENRVIARFGLSRARVAPFVGLQALIHASGLADEKLGEFEVGFRLGPRLNAAGRMGHAREAVELFTTATPERAAVIAEHLSLQNQARRQVEAAILDQACSLAESNGMTRPDRRAIVLAHPDWHAGVVGIVCSRLVERFHRPAILMQARDGACHGSARSIDAFDLHAALSACAAHLDTFGGHTMAAGLHLVESKLPAFTDAFLAHAHAHINEDRLRPLLSIDCPVEPHELTPDAVAALDTLAPFGAGNPTVKILLRDVRIDMPPKLMGGSGKHLALQLRGHPFAGRPGPMFRAVAWNWGDQIDRVAAGMMTQVVATPKISLWTGRPVVEMEVRDLSPQ